MKYHIIAFFGGFLLDCLFGDPYCLPHPIRLIGRGIGALEKKLRNGRQDFRNGCILVILMLFLELAVTSVILSGAYFVSPWLGMVIEMIMTYQILAARCLQVESMKVYHSLKNEGIEAARKAVSMIVGRDTNCLDEEGVAKAAVETVAENTSDGVIAPMIFTAIFGPVGGFFYKTVNTMDSMIGYKNEKYLYFGKAAAKLDDVVNFIPARISAWLMMFAAFLGGKKFDGKRAYRIYKRDRFNHASPNSAQTESVCAGALGIRLAGDASYFGKIVKKPYIGDACRKVQAEDICLANKLMYLTTVLCEGLCLLALLCAAYWR